ncbi:non-ribosomal peptide synthetase [Oscillibacter sp.]|uniref:non-ribosomal peptide synthetase n=1 Tax=Oscillibacter sp. TaxID=1945593 RepID=UPI00262C4619|nr:non-ribosomal peptide synthetase [Oscillibacter sp.]MDD3347414.1 amino acid adenylation domain-containing protein [Oscillibacter sp.]
MMDVFQTGNCGEFPLSLSQQNIWSLEQACPGTSINNICTTLRIRGRVDLTVLQQSVDLVLAADASLRTRIALHDRLPVQYQAAFVQEQFPVYDFTQTSREGIENWEAAVTRETIPLLEGPLYRFLLFRAGEQDGGLVMKLHHIISDGWTQILLCNRIGQAYLDLLAGKEAAIDPCPSYELHVKEETEYLKSRAYGRDEGYWSSVLERSGEPSVLKSVKSAAASPVGRRKSFRLPQALNNAIYTYCAQNRVAPFTVFYLALAIYFKRMGGAERFTIGVPIFNRTDYRFKQTSGMFVNTLPFFNELHGDWTLRQCAENLGEQWLEMLRHQRMPFPHIQRLAQRSGSGDGRLFHIALSYQNGQMRSSRDASVSFSGRWHYSGYQMEQLCIHLSNVEEGHRYAVDYDYLTQFFSQREIEDLHGCLMNILRESLASPDVPVCRLPILEVQERERVLYTFNRTDTPLYDEDLYQRFADAAARHPDRAALICAGGRTTYRQLEEVAAQVQSTLEPVSKQPGLAAVLLPRKPGLFAAMLGILRAGWAFVLLSPDLPENRLREILRQSGAAVLITEGTACSAAVDLGLRMIDMEHLSAGTLPARSAQPSDLAYVVYTSGSTGAPKGVEISRGSLLNLADAMAPVYGSGAVVSLCSVGFDAFLLESAAALLNARTILLPEDRDLESPGRLAELIEGYGVGFLSITPSRLSALMKHPNFRRALRRMESLVCGGEAFPSDLLQRLRQATHASIYNQYGPSEATVGVSLKRLNEAAAITAGAPMQNCRLYVLDAWMNPLPVGVYGNLYIGGLCVGLGYRNRPDLTEECFLDSPFELGERLYRTGDTACWTSEGEIVLGGRTDRQVKLRGLRVEPQEVSACLCTHPQVKQCAAVVLEQAGESVLVAYYTAERPVPEEELLSFAASYLPHYMVPAAIVRVETIPLTGNGKVDEAKLPVPSFTVSGNSAPETETERTVLAIFAQVLGKPDLGVQSDYFLCGGNSLNAMETISRIAETVGPMLRVADLYTCHNARRVAALLESHRGAAAPAPHLRPAPKADRYPLSPAQQGIYVQSCLDPTGVAYQMPGAFRMAGVPDLSRLQRAFARLIEEEPLLRTAFVQEADGIFQRVAPQASFELTALSGGDFASVCKTLLAPFHMDRAPLLRATVWEEEEGKWSLLINLHHIIGDGLTTPVLMRRLDALYQGGALHESTLSYLDYAWQRSAEKRGDERVEYWKQHLSPLPEPMELPTDFARGHHFDYRGNTAALTLDPKLSAACDAYCAQMELSPYMLFLAAFALLLSRLSGREDLIVGVPSAGRLLPETREMCGPFINTLPLRLAPAANVKTAEYLHAVRNEVNEMLDHQQIGLEEIVAALDLPRSLAQSPLYQVMFTQRPLDADAFTLGGEKLTYRPIPTGTAKMDLVVELAREGDAYTFQAEYASSLYEAETVAYWFRCLEQLIRSFLTGAEKPLCELGALAPQDRIALIDAPNHTVTPFVNLPLHAFIAQEAELDPDAGALIFHDTVYTRAQLESMACRIANLLCAAGVQHGGKVGIAVKRGPLLVASMVGILKAGCAYVPLLSSFPEQRLRYMLETAQITHVLCDEETRSALPGDLPCTLVDVAGQAEETFTPVPVTDGDLCNILFTSGSTGKPKGVMLCHRSVSNMFLSMRQLMARADGPILCTTNLVFDTFVAETLLSLAMGKQLVMCDEEEMMLPWKLAEIILRHHVEIVQFTPARFQMCLSNDAFSQATKHLKLVLFGGELLTPLLLGKTCEATDAITVNMYGPTEATVYMTMVDVRPGRPVSIGRPLKNGRIYVLDDEGRPVLPTAYGELWLAGEVLSAGYISRPDLTEKAFLPDPFFPGERMYRTGDIARMRLDGCYDFRGRRDSQVKLNGQRVELEEITGAIMTSGCALLAATVPVRHSDGSMQLCAFYQPNPNGRGGKEEILSHMRAVLPVYMLPSRIVALSAMPHTASSKIDLRTLTEMAASYDGGAEEPNETAPEERTPQMVPVQALQTPPQAAPVQTLPPVIPPQTAPEAVSPKAAPQTIPPQAAPQAVPVAAAAEAAQTPPAGQEDDLKALLLGLWEQVLGRKGLRDDLPFFAQGGTSLAALSVLSHYHNHKLVMSLQQFYDHPTAREQAALLEPKGAPMEHARTIELCRAEPPAPVAPSGDEGASAAHMEKAAAQYPRLVPELPRGKTIQKNVGTVLLTGATGFLGAHVLRELLDAGAQRVFCLLRGGDRQRLLDTLSWYFGSGWTGGCADGIEVLSGDITKAGLGLTPEAYRQVSGSLCAVWHCAADVRHYAADEEAFLRTNLAGTENLIKLARAACVPLYHMSTGSVSGQRLEGTDESAVFTEADFCIGQDWRSNLYVRSKFLAENAVMEAVRAGLTARIFRLGRLVGRSSDGTFQKNPESNAFWLTMRGIHALGAIPAGMASAPVELTPVDWCAGAAVALRNAPMTVYHLQNPEPCTLEESARAIAPWLEVLPDGEFSQWMERALKKENSALLSPLMDFRQRAQTSPATVAITNERTMEQLEKAGFHRRIPDPARILRAFRYDEAQRLDRREWDHDI